MAQDGQSNSCATFSVTGSKIYDAYSNSIGQGTASIEVGTGAFSLVSKLNGTLFTAAISSYLSIENERNFYAISDTVIVSLPQVYALNALVNRQPLRMGKPQNIHYATRYVGQKSYELKNHLGNLRLG